MISRKKTRRKPIDLGWLEKYKVFRRFALLWSMGIITWTVHYILVNKPVLAVATATFGGSVIGLFAAAIGLYQYQRYKEDKENADRNKD